MKLPNPTMPRFVIESLPWPAGPVSCCDVARKRGPHRRNIMALSFWARVALVGVARELALVPLTTEAVHARCARYDETPPNLPKTLKQPAILVFTKITGFRDNPSVDAATKALTAMAAREHWTLVFSDNGAV